MQTLIEELREVIRDGRVMAGEEALTLYAQDVFTRDAPAGLVVAPGSVEELQGTVRKAAAAGRAVVARGGGMSYTSGYVPAEEESVVLELSGLDRIIEINREDMYVTVEAGVTWKALHEALQGSGVRTPYWGTLSGLYATVGGGMSQNSIFWGSGHHGSAADSVIGLEVVLADGSLLATGSAAQANAQPFFRHFGPDLTGLFTCDCGALGIKARVTLRLVPAVEGWACGSFAFDSYQDMSPAMSEIARRGLASECFGFDPYLQRQRMKRESLAKDAKQFMGMLKSSGSLGKAVKDGAKAAVAGRRFMDDVEWSFNVLTSERESSAAKAAMDEVRDIVANHNGRKLPDTIPKMIRSHPFGPVNNMLGAEGERWVPVHGLVPHSRAVEVMGKVESLFAEHAGDMGRLEINTGYLLATVSTNCFVIEPVFFWPDAVREMHQKYVEADHLKRLKAFDENPEAYALVKHLKAALSDLFHDEGAVHLQVGKAYRYADGIKPEALALIKALKQHLDPNNRMNPGALGL